MQLLLVVACRLHGSGTQRAAEGLALALPAAVAQIRLPACLRRVGIYGSPCVHIGQLLDIGQIINGEIDPTGAQPYRQARWLFGTQLGILA